MSAKHVSRKKKDRRTHRTSVLPANHPAGRKKSIGHEERLAAYVKRALQLKREGLFHHEIADTIAEEFVLEKVPATTTIADWLRRGLDAIVEDIKELQFQMRIDAFNQLETLKRKWMTIALADHLEIRRWKMVAGERQPLLDEDAIAEQIEAANLLIQIMNRQAKLLGLDMSKTDIRKSAGDENPSIEELKKWMAA